MISSEASDSVPEKVCEECGGPLALRPARPYPVVLQIVFAASFLGFLALTEKFHAHRSWIWAWTTLQLILGIFLIRARMQARHRVWRCVRCSAELR